MAEHSGGKNRGEYDGGGVVKKKKAGNWGKNLNVIGGTTLIRNWCKIETLRKGCDARDKGEELVTSSEKEWVQEFGKGGKSIKERKGAAVERGLWRRFGRKTSSAATQQP